MFVSVFKSYKHEDGHFITQHNMIRQKTIAQIKCFNKGPICNTNRSIVSSKLNARPILCELYLV